ncbi:MAG: YkgJ family cysteine cluster protein [Candidatus Altiarchaeota archaeon]
MVDPLSMFSVLTVLVFMVAGVIAAILPKMHRAYLLGRVRHEFKCTCCGNCCRFRITPVTPEDVKRLADAGETGFSASVDGEGSLKRVNGRCVFLKDDKCRVHGHRPAVCREFPFYRLYGIWFCTDSRMCPGLDKLREMV